MPIKKVMISAGEASGDLHAANLVKALHQIDPTIRVNGMGSEHMRDVGVDILYDCKDIQVMGIVEVLAKWNTIMGALDILKQNIAHNPPDLLILVDYQEFNLKLAKAAKKHGVKVMFYIGPQVWAWRSHRVKKIGRHIDMMAVLFPFEVDFYTKANVPVSYVGNPLVDDAVASMPPAESKKFFGLDANRQIVGLFPGSRKSEVCRLLPTVLDSARLIKQKKPDTQFVLPLARAIDTAAIDAILNQYHDIEITITRDHIHDLMQSCDAIITASGTASLETALMGTPMVIIYKLSNLSYTIMKRMITIDNIGLPNIVAGKQVVKEMLQEQASPENISNEILHILNDDSYRSQIKTELAEVKNKLGTSGGSEKVARLAYEMLYPEETNQS